MPFTNELLQFNNNYFVETGTYKGDVIDTILNYNIFKQIYSIELSSVFYQNCKDKFKDNSNVEIIFGNSKYELTDIIKDIKEPITFWLDAHWSGVQDVGCDKDTICPILEELDQIKNHPINSHTIIINDIRLMNGKDFPVKLIDIIVKLREINPDYSLRFFNDHVAVNDVLVAHIDRRICIHNYLTHCKTNPQPPGLADFLRGTCALFKFCKIYNYTLKLDNTHPIFRFLKSNNIVKNYDTNVIELIPDQFSYNDIFYKLDTLFKHGNSFCVLTNSFYNRDDAGNVTNFGPITEDCKVFLKDILTPNKYLQDRISSIYQYFSFDANDDYYIIHVRLGDSYIHNNTNTNENIFNHINNKINFHLSYVNKPIMLITDCRDLGLRLRDHPRDNKHKFIYWDNCKTHLGDLQNATPESISDTLIDFFIMSKAKQIFYLNESGFSKICSLIYDIEYIRI